MSLVIDGTVERGGFRRAVALTAEPGRPVGLTGPNGSGKSTTLRAIAEGIEKPMPTDPPVGEKIAVLTPITSPARLNNGPPELPRLIEASVWMKSS